MNEIYDPPCERLKYNYETMKIIFGYFTEVYTLGDIKPFTVQGAQFDRLYKKVLSKMEAMIPDFCNQDYNAKEIVVFVIINKWIEGE